MTEDEDAHYEFAPSDWSNRQTQSLHFQKLSYSVASSPLLPDFLTHSKGRLLLVFDKEAIPHFAQAQQFETVVGMMCPP